MKINLTPNQAPALHLNSTLYIISQNIKFVCRRDLCYENDTHTHCVTLSLSCHKKCDTQDKISYQNTKNQKEISTYHLNALPKMVNDAILNTIDDVEHIAKWKNQR